MEKLEKDIKEGLDPHTTEIRKVQIRQGEYEFRCKTKNDRIRILTFHLKLANRSFILQWIWNLFTEEKERVFMGVKIGGGEFGDEDPVYRFDVVPYRQKGFIRQRHEEYVKYDDIPTGSKVIDRKFMVKSESAAYVEQFVRDPEFLRLLHDNHDYLEHLGIRKANEETDPHISITYEFNGTKVDPIQDFCKLFFLLVNQHLKNHDRVKRLIQKGDRGRAKGKRRGRARRGVATGRRK